MPKKKEAVVVSTEPLEEVVVTVEEPLLEEVIVPAPKRKKKVKVEVVPQFVEGQLIVRITKNDDGKHVILTSSGVTYTFSDEEYKISVK